jgi:hypothetical protein
MVDYNSAFTGAQVDAAVAATLQTFTSAAQTIASAGLLTIPHGLAEKPSLIQCYLECTTAENGYAIGDRLMISPNTTTALSDRSQSIIADATNFIIRFSNNANVFSGTNATTGVAITLTNGSWNFFIVGFAPIIP